MPPAARTTAATAAAWMTALDTGLDRLRDEAMRRACDGVEETVWHRGEAVGTVRRYSDRLLMFLLRAHQPAVYRVAVGAGERPWIAGSSPAMTIGGGRVRGRQ